MSDAKKSGGRDISELKQRLGLKKGGPAQPAASARSGGVVAPPGMSLPPPPGLAPAAPPQPVIPNAADDPFGAMNAMAAVGTVQRAPEIVIVNDGKPVENVGAQSQGATIARMAIPAAIALIVGVTVGKIGTGAANHNDGIKGTKAILGDKSAPGTVLALKSALSDLDNLLDDATKKGFKPDLEVDKQLKAISGRLDVKNSLTFARYTSDAVALQVMQFYGGVQEIKSLIDTHNKAAAFDDIALKKGKAAADAASPDGQLKYAALITAPTDTDKSDPFGARIVEIAGVYCDGGKTVAPKCGEGQSVSGYAYRNDPGAAATQGDLLTQGADSVPTKKLVPLVKNGELDALIKTGDPGLSELLYTKRLKAIYDRVHGKTGQDGKPVGGLLDDGNKLEGALQAEAAKGTRFSFFM